VTKTLTLRYERKLFLLTETPDARRLIGKYVEVFQFPDGRIEIRAGGMVLPYTVYDKLGEFDQGTVVENKRLGQVLRIAQLVQAQREIVGANRPSTAHRTNGKYIPRPRLPGTKTQRELGPEGTCVEQSRSRRPANTCEHEGVPGGHF
jgi:hypothetical protein